MALYPCHIQFWEDCVLYSLHTDPHCKCVQVCPLACMLHQCRSDLRYYLWVLIQAQNIALLLWKLIYPSLPLKLTESCLCHTVAFSLLMNGSWNKSGHKVLGKMVNKKEGIHTLFCKAPSQDLPLFYSFKPVCWTCYSIEHLMKMIKKPKLHSQ